MYRYDTQYGHRVGRKYNCDMISKWARVRDVCIRTDEVGLTVHQIRSANNHDKDNRSDPKKTGLLILQAGQDLSVHLKLFLPPVSNNLKLQ